MANIKVMKAAREYRGGCMMCFCNERDVAIVSFQREYKKVVRRRNLKKMQKHSNGKAV